MESRVKDMKKFTSGVSELIGEFWEDLEDLPPGGCRELEHLLDQLPMEAPHKPDQWEDVLDDVRKMIIPNVSCIYFSSVQFS